MDGMTFDAGTWWLIALLAAALIGAVTFLVKRTVFGRVDDMAKQVKEVTDTSVKKVDYDKDTAKIERDIEQIKKDYTPKSVHEKDFDEVRGDIKKIKEDFITKDDFLREMNKFDRKLDRQDEKIDRLINMLLRERGITNE